MQVPVPAMPATKAVVYRAGATADHPGMNIRLAGDRYVQVEYGPMEMDLNLR